MARLDGQRSGARWGGRVGRIRRRSVLGVPPHRSATVGGTATRLSLLDLPAIRLAVFEPSARDPGRGGTGRAGAPAVRYRTGSTARPGRFGLRRRASHGDGRGGGDRQGHRSAGSRRDDDQDGRCAGPARRRAPRTRPRARTREGRRRASRDRRSRCRSARRRPDREQKSAPAARPGRRSARRT